MAFMNLKFFSQALGMQTEVYAVIPQTDTAGEIGVSASRSSRRCLYLLHGLSDDHSIWLRRTSIERYATDLGICVVMPAAARSFYTDMKYGQAYYTYIARELPALMNEFIGISTRREDNFIAGLSMGGYGALKIGLRECDHFCAAAGLSSVIDMTSWQRDPRLFAAIFGENGQVPQEDDLFRLLKKQQNNPNRPRLFTGIGTEDSLYQENLRFRDEARSLGYDLTWRESHGDHQWSFWDEYIQYVLRWMFPAETEARHD